MAVELRAPVVVPAVGPFLDTAAPSTVSLIPNAQQFRAPRTSFQTGTTPTDAATPLQTGIELVETAGDIKKGVEFAFDPVGTALKTIKPVTTGINKIASLTGVAEELISFGTGGALSTAAEIAAAEAITATTTFAPLSSAAVSAAAEAALIAKPVASVAFAAAEFAALEGGATATAAALAGTEAAAAVATTTTATTGFFASASSFLAAAAPLIALSVVAFIATKVFGDKSPLTESSFFSTVTDGQIGDANIASKKLDPKAGSAVFTGAQELLKNISTLGGNVTNQQIGGGITNNDEPGPLVGFLQLLNPQGGRGDIIPGSRVEFDPNDIVATQAAFAEIGAQMVLSSAASNPDLANSINTIVNEQDITPGEALRQLFDGFDARPEANNFKLLKATGILIAPRRERSIPAPSGPATTKTEAFAPPPTSERVQPQGITIAPRRET